LVITLERSRGSPIRVNAALPGRGARSSQGATQNGAAGADYPPRRSRTSMEGGMSTAQMVRQLVVFSLGEEEYALPITRVQEIIRYTEPRAVASEARWIRGVISLRG